MKKHLHTSHIDVRKVLTLCVVILCLCAGLAIYSTVHLRSKSVDTVQQYAGVFVSKLSGELQNNNSYMENTIMNSSYRNMYYQGELNWVEQTETPQNTFLFLNQLSINRYNFFVYNTSLDAFLELTAVTMPFAQYQMIRQQLRSLARGSFENGYYYVWEWAQGQRLVLSMWGYGEFICGSWITEEELVDGLEALSENIGNFCLVTEDDLPEAEEDTSILYDLTSIESDFRIGIQVDGDPDITQIMVLQVIQLALLLIGMAAVLTSVTAVHKNLLNPIRNLAEVLNKYKKADTAEVPLDAQIRDTLDDTYTVLSQLGEEFETMSIRLYEAELEKRQLDINFRNAQIRPHFLVNNLTTIHDMAQLNETEKIQNLTVALSNYYRYVLRDCMDMVPLRQELRHMDNILQVYREWSANSIQAAYQVEEGLLDEMIPVLLVSTFLENSIKHGASTTGSLNITVFAGRQEQEGKSFLYLRIRDNGGGFPQELLDCLDRGEPIPETNGRHIGINNSIQRLRLIYGGGARISLSNYLDGAQVEIWIPIGGQKNEAADCG